MSLKRASYRDATDWIAQNDSPGDSDALDPDAVAGLVSTHLVADIFGTTAERVAADVVRRRKALLKAGPIAT